MKPTTIPTARHTEVARVGRAAPVARSPRRTQPAQAPHPPGGAVGRGRTETAARRRRPVPECHLTLPATGRTAPTLTPSTTRSSSSAGGDGRPDDCLSCHTTNFQPATGEFDADGVGCMQCHDPHSQPLCRRRRDVPELPRGFDGRLPEDLHVSQGMAAWIATPRSSRPTRCPTTALCPRATPSTSLRRRVRPATRTRCTPASRDSGAGSAAHRPGEPLL